MTALTAPAPLVQLRTGLLETTVHPAGDGRFSWVREVGTAAPQPFATIPGAVLAALEAIAAQRTVQFVIGQGGASRRRYDVAGSGSVAGQLLSRSVPNDLPGLMHGIGELLRRLHAVPLPGELAGEKLPAAGGLGGSRGVGRLADWLNGRARRFWAAQFASDLRDQLGRKGWGALHSALDMLSAAAEPVLGHGGLSLGSVVPAAQGGRADLLIGEDVCAASWFVDPGWLIGELAELRWQLGEDVTDWPALLGAFATGYGRDLDERCQQVAVLRIALHLHDYLAYVSPDPRELRRYAALLAALIRNWAT